MWTRALTRLQLFQNRAEICSDCSQSAAKKDKKKKLARSTSSCMSPMLSSCDPGDQLHVAARRPESAIVNPDARHARCSLNEGSGLGWGRVAAQLITGVNGPNWISLSLHMVTSWSWYLQQYLFCLQRGNKVEELCLLCRHPQKWNTEMNRNGPIGSYEELSSVNPLSPCFMGLWGLCPIFD